MKLILLNGPAGIGKSTIARKYISEHPLSMSVEGDQIMGMIGAWREHELEARVLKFAQIKGMIEVALSDGHDVILPYLVTDASHVEIFEQLAKKYDTHFYEVILYAEKAEAVRRLLVRGTWGEEGSKQLTDADTPRIERLYDLMISQLEKRPRMIRIEAKESEADLTYSRLLGVVA